MLKIAIVYHSGYGHTEVQANHVYKGANSVDGIEATLLKSSDVEKSPEQLNDYDGMIFGCPTYMGAVSAPFKSFMDSTAGLWFAQKWKDKIAAGFTNSGSLSGDKFNTLVQLVTFATQHGMIWVPPAEMNASSSNDEQSGDPKLVNRAGSYIGAMSQSDNLPADQTPPSGDLKTAELLGKRVAEATIRWNK
jgi:multimeric flavodoxin WrbA